MKITSLFALGLLLVACATGYVPVYRYNEIIVVNVSGRMLQDVTVRERASGRLYQCGNMGAADVCRQRFGARRLERSGFEIGWSIDDATQTPVVVVVDVPLYFVSGQPLRGVFEIGPGGKVAVDVEQDERFRGEESRRENGGNIFVTPLSILSENGAKSG